MIDPTFFSRVAQAAHDDRQRSLRGGCARNRPAPVGPLRHARRIGRVATRRLARRSVRPAQAAHGSR
jgi:hypothetical protein